MPHLIIIAGPNGAGKSTAARSGSKNSDQNLKELRYNSRQESWRRDEREAQKIHAC